jgi:hypothetical protein
MKRTCLPRLATPAEVARVLGVPLHRVLYVLRSRPHILPRAIAGAARCFDDDAIARVRHEVNSIDARRVGKAVRNAS